MDYRKSKGDKIMNVNLRFSIPKWAIMLAPFIAFCAVIVMLVKYYLTKF